MHLFFQQQTFTELLICVTSLFEALMLSHCSCVQLCDPMDCSLPGSSVHGFLQASILGRVAMPSCRGSSQPRHLEPLSLISPALAGGFFITSATWKAQQRKKLWQLFGNKQFIFSGIILGWILMKMSFTKCCVSTNMWFSLDFWKIEDVCG